MDNLFNSNDFVRNLISATLCSILISVSNGEPLKLPMKSIVGQSEVTNAEGEFRFPVDLGSKLGLKVNIPLELVFSIDELGILTYHLSPWSSKFYKLAENKLKVELPSLGDYTLVKNIEGNWTTAEQIIIDGSGRRFTATGKLGDNNLIVDLVNQHIPSDKYTYSFGKGGSISKIAVGEETFDITNDKVNLVTGNLLSITRDGQNTTVSGIGYTLKIDNPSPGVYDVSHNNNSLISMIQMLNPTESNLSSVVIKKPYSRPIFIEFDKDKPKMVRNDGFTKIIKSDPNFFHSINAFGQSYKRSYDYKRGVQTVETTSGEVYETIFYSSPVYLRAKPRKVTYKKNNNVISVQNFFYDSTGNLIRTKNE